MRSIRHSPRTTRTAWRYRAGMPRATASFEMQRLHGMGEALYHGMSDTCPVRVYAPVGTHEDCSPIWCAGCWRTAPTPASCIAWSIRRCRRRRSSPIPCARVRALGAQRQSAHSAAARLLSGPAQFRRVRSGRSCGAHRPRSLDRRPPPCRAKLDGTGPARENSQPRRSAHRLVGADRRCRRRPRSMPRCDVLARGWRDWDAARRRASRRSAGTRRRPDRGGARRAAVPAGARRRQDPGRRHRGSSRGRRLLPLVRRSRARATSPRRASWPGRPASATPGRSAGAACSPAISPWNFPLAIFTGQVAAALAAGNAVAAKPAEQTPLVAARAVALLHAGRRAARRARTCCPATGRSAQALVSDPRIAGVAFTGGTETAQGDRPRRSPRGPGRSCRSSPRPAASTR